MGGTRGGHGGGDGGGLGARGGLGRDRGGALALSCRPDWGGPRAVAGAGSEARGARGRGRGGARGRDARRWALEHPGSALSRSARARFPGS